MPYTTLDTLLLSLGAKQRDVLLKKAGETDLTNAAARLAVAVAVVQSEIDSALASAGYVLPLADPPPAEIQACSDALCAEFLARTGSDALTDHILKSAKFWRDWLDRVRRRQQLLPGLTQQSDPSYNDSIMVQSRPRVFDNVWSINSVPTASGLLAARGKGAAGS